MLTEVAVAYADVTAAGLCLALGLPPQPALATRRVQVGGFDVELRILGASHQVIVGETISETVACLDQPTGPLPGSAERAAGALTYRFESRVDQLPPETIEGRGREVRTSAADDALSLAAVFPMSSDALTAIWCAPLEHGITWTTLHLYPQTHEGVTTTSELTA